jgi:hypothetical protein
MRPVFAAVAATAVLAGCATITKGTTQNIAVDTPGAPGAQCTLSSEGISTVNVVTPGTVTVDKSKHAINIRCKKECYQDGAGVVSSNTEAMTAGNILVGGVVGLGVDAASGAMNKYNEQNQIVMVPVAGCRPAGEMPSHGRRQPI